LRYWPLMVRAAGLAVFVAAAMLFSVAWMLADVRASEPPAPRIGVAVSNPPAADTPAPPVPEATALPAPAPLPVHASFEALAQTVNAIIAGSGADVGVSLIELGGPVPSAWSDGGSTQVDAASTYKLVALMDEANLISAGRQNPKGSVCFQDDDYEDGWYDDYASGSCYMRNDLAQRAGLFSDNTAGHMLVRDVGGSVSLNAFAAGLGARRSSFFDNNTTCADDLAQLLAAEAQGRAGGAAAQSWLYPLLTRTKFEAGIPAGSPGAVVIHKTGDVDAVVVDAALVTGGKNGPYALAVTTDGVGGDAAWSTIADVAGAVWQYETAR